MFSMRKNLKLLGIVGVFVLFLMIAPMMNLAQKYGLEKVFVFAILLLVVLGVALLSAVVLKHMGSKIWAVCAVLLGLCTVGSAAMMINAQGWDHISYMLLFAGVFLPLLVGWLVGGVHLFFRRRKQGFRGVDAVEQSKESNAPAERDS